MACEEEVESSLVTVDPNAREILLFGVVNTELATQVVFNVRQLDRGKKANISLVIGSAGGEEYSGWAIYDTLCLARSKIIGQCFGECMSIAVLILQACDTRLLAPNCRMMIHNGSLTAGSLSYEKFQALIKEENLITQKYYEALAERSGLSTKKVIELCNQETYMSAEEAVNHGFADGILGQTKKRKK
jgi:ATP-dependent Clp protease, protease subunit